MPKFKVLFLGLGRMGFHMSAHLSKSKNIDLFIYNRSKKKVNYWLKVTMKLKNLISKIRLT